MSAKQSNFHYNPDWLSDNALVENFVARQDDFAFLRDELARAPLVGSAQHYLIVGLRGAGKTTLLKRLAIAIRNDEDINDHLIALSFPEELYDVKSLADFWWVACTALVDELDRLGQQAKADQLMDTVDRTKRLSKDPLADVGLKLLLETCATLERRPILLVDNLDLVFQRIDKKGRQLKDPHAPAYWALREALSTTTSPIVIGGSVRLSEPFTDYDKAFYDFFLPKRLGKLSFDEVRRVLERLADAQNLPGIKKRLHTRPSRVEALYELTGGNPRAIGLIFELLRQGPNSRAVEDFERLMDNTTPYYKARFEDLSEQAQVVMHALAVRRPGNGSGLRFGHTAAEIGSHAGLATGTVSAQMDVLEREGLVEKSAAHGRTQYRIAEQLFRLWLQMRSNRRIRQNVIGLTEFLEAMYDFDELLTNLQSQSDTSALAEAKLCFAVADTCDTDQWRRGLEAQGADRLLQHVQDHGGTINDYLTSGELAEDLSAVVSMREQLQRCKGGGLTPQQQHALLGSVELSQEQKQVSVNALCSIDTAPKEVAFLRQHFERERQRLLRYGLRNADLPLLFQKRAMGHLPLPKLTPEDAESICVQEKGAPTLRSMVWRLVGTRTSVKITDESMAKEWLKWGMDHQREAPPTEWANVAGTMRRAGHLAEAKTVLDQAFTLAPPSRAWFEKGALLSEIDGKHGEAETAYRKAIELDPADAFPWNNLGNLLKDKLNRFDEAESAYRKAIELDPTYTFPWNNLGALLKDKLNRFDEAESAYRKAIELDPAYTLPWNNLGALLKDKLNRFDEAESAYRKAIELDPAFASPWINLGNLLTDKLNRFDEAESAYRKAIELNPADAPPWNNLGALLTDKLNRFDEAESAYRKAIELDPAYTLPWNNLGSLLHYKLNRFDEAESAYRKAIELDPAYTLPWNNLGNLLHYKLNRFDEAESAYRKAIELDPAFASPWNNLGNLLHYKLNRFDEAESAYRKAIELDPAFASPWINLGNLQKDKLNRFDEAESAYCKAIELNPIDALPWNNLGALLKDKLNRFDEAESAYRKAIELDPAYASPWINLGNLLKDKLNRFDEAESAYRKAIELDPADALPWNNLGSLMHYKLNRFDEAESAYRKAIELDPAYAFPWNNLGSLMYYKLNRFNEAESAYRKVIELDPAYALPWNNLGSLMHYKLDRFDEAEIAYRKAIELDPADALPWNNLGNLLYYKFNQFDEAESAYRKAIELDPAYASPWINLGNLLTDNLNRFDEAESAYRKAIEIAPTDATLWDHLAYLLGELQNRYSEAEEVCRKAIDINPNHVQTWNNLGFLLGERLNKPRESEAAYRKALEIDPEYEWTWNNLGILLEAQDRIDEAEYAYSRGARLGLEAYPYWGRRRTELQTSRYTTVAEKALETGNLPMLRDTLGRLLVESRDIAGAVVSPPFVECFLAHELATGKNASVLLDILRHLGYEKHARPLLLAFEAAIANRPDKLADIEPEVQQATQHMFDRLSAQRE